MIYHQLKPNLLQILENIDNDNVDSIIESIKNLIIEIQNDIEYIESYSDEGI